MHNSSTEAPKQCALDLWWAKPSTVRPATIAAQAWAMSEAERARCARYARAQDRHRCGLSRWMVRGLLSQHTGRAPESLRMREGAHGKPWVENAPAFNLSHSEAMIVVGLGPRELGVDVEHHPRRCDMEAIARRYFAPVERHDLERAADPRLHFFGLWTMKEAYLKAVGAGLSLPLREVIVRLEDLQVREVRLGEGIDDEASRWAFGLMRLGAEHIVAGAVRREPDEPPGLAWRCRPWDKRAL